MRRDVAVVVDESRTLLVGTAVAPVERMRWIFTVLTALTLARDASAAPNGLVISGLVGDHFHRISGGPGTTSVSTAPLPFS